MDRPLHFTWNIYMHKFEKILVLMLLTTLPILLFHSVVTNYMYAVSAQGDTAYLFADLFYALLTLIFYLYAQIPFIRFVYNEHQGIENSLRNALYHFLANGFTVFVFACIVSLLSTIGFMLLVLPGLIILALLFPIPYITIFDDKSVWKSFKEGLRLGKKYYWKLALLIGLAGGMELIFGIVITVQLFNVTDSFMAQVITQIALNIIIYPFIVILITCYILKWRESLHTFDLAK